MRVEVVMDMGIKDDEVEHEVSFQWDLGEAPVPVRETSIAFGSVITVVERVQYQCADREYIESRDHLVRPVEIELRVALTTDSATAKGKDHRAAAAGPLYSPQELHQVLSSLASVSEIYVSGVYDPQ